MMKKILLLLSVCTAFIVSGCELMNPPKKDKSRKLTLMELGIEEQMRIQGFKAGNPTFIRIFKQENVLEVWIAQNDGTYRLYRSFPICIFSGTLGPKKIQGDKQSPEGFYNVTRNALNPNSQYHLSFNLGYPNAYDRAHGYTGDLLMVHGECKSVGCYAMGNDQIEVIYALVALAFKKGQTSVPVHIFPFRMTATNMSLYKDHEAYDFWEQLKPGFEYFEQWRRVPQMIVKDKRYYVDYANSVPAASNAGTLRLRSLSERLGYDEDGLSVTKSSYE